MDSQKNEIPPEKNSLSVVEPIPDNKEPEEPVLTTRTNSEPEIGEKEPLPKLKQGQHRTPFVFTAKRQDNLAKANLRKKEKQAEYIILQEKLSQAEAKLKAMEPKKTEKALKVVPVKKEVTIQAPGDSDSDSDTPPPVKVAKEAEKVRRKVKSLVKPDPESSEDEEEEARKYRKRARKRREADESSSEEEEAAPKRKRKAEKKRYYESSSSEEEEVDTRKQYKQKKPASAAGFNIGQYGKTVQKGARSGCIF